MKKYKTGRYPVVIEEIEVLRETESCVYVPGFRGGERRQLKSTFGNRIHNSWDEAYAYLVSGAEDEIEHVKRKLKLAEAKLAGVKALKKPETINAG